MSISIPYHNTYFQPIQFVHINEKIVGDFLTAIRLIRLYNIVPKLFIPTVDITIRYDLV